MPGRAAQLAGLSGLSRSVSEVALTASAAPGGLTPCQHTRPKKMERESQERRGDQITPEVQRGTAAKTNPITGRRRFSAGPEGPDSS